MQYFNNEKIENQQGFYLSNILLDLGQTRQLESIYLSSEKDDYKLMQQAASAIFKKIIEEYKFDKNVIISIFVGSGNNGGDGYEIGSLFLENNFKNISVIEVVSQKSGIAANFAKQKYINKKGKIVFFKDFYQNNSKCDVIIDAILGIGVKTNPSGKINQNIIDAINFINKQKDSEIISVDIPSGLLTENGMLLNDTAVVADCTITVFTSKLGLYLGFGKNHIGKVFVVLNHELANFEEVCKELTKQNIYIKLDVNYVKRFIPKRTNCAHKGDAGKLLLLGGNKGYEGALIISALGAIRTGIGLSCAIPLSGNPFVFNIINPVIMTSCVENIYEKFLWADSIVFGPGLGKIEINDRFITILESSKPKVVDADGLNFIKNYNIKCGDNTIFTPHIKEAASLLNISTKEVLENPIKSARDISLKYNGVCVLKSATTIIVDAHKNLGNRVFIAPVGVSGMASGGMGDLLTGIIGTFLAQQCDSLTAACLGVVIHGTAGEICATKEGNLGICAMDLIPYIRGIINN